MIDQTFNANYLVIIICHSLILVLRLTKFILLGLRMYKSRSISGRVHQGRKSGGFDPRVMSRGLLTPLHLIAKRGLPRLLWFTVMQLRKASFSGILMHLLDISKSLLLISLG